MTMSTSGLHDDCVSAFEQKQAEQQREQHDGIGADGRAEAERLRVRVEELQADKRRLEIKIAGLESEVEELRAKLATGTGGDMSASEFQTAIKKWEDTVETQRGIIAKLESENANLRAGVAAPPAAAAG
jgi:chromosome segregation ATPase